MIRSSSKTTLRILINLVMFGLILIIKKLGDPTYYEKGIAKHYFLKIGT